MPGFSIVAGPHLATGLDADLCRAIAAGIFGTPGHLEFHALDTIDQFLADDRIDLVFHGLTWTSARERRWRIAFAAISFHDGQTIAVRNSVRDMHRLARGPICVERGTIFEQALADAHPRWRLLRVRGSAAARRAFVSGACVGWSWDASGLMARLAGTAARRYRLLTQRYSYEPLAPIVRARDRDLLASVRTSIDAVIDAERRGLTQAMAGRRGAADQAVAATGNYGEIYARNLEGPLRIAADRGPNRLARDGGMLKVPSIREPEVTMAGDARAIDSPGLRGDVGRAAAPR